MAKNVWEINKFDGGLNDYSDPKDIKSNEFANIQDTYISKSGSVRPLGRCVIDDTIPKISIKNDIIPGEGAFAFKTNYGFSAAQTPSDQHTEFALQQTSVASNGEYARAQFKIVSMVWAFTSSESTHGLSYHDNLIKAQGNLKFTMYLDSTAITTEQTVLTLNGTDEGSSSWFDDKTLNSDMTAVGTDRWLSGSTTNYAAPKDYACPWNIWMRDTSAGYSIGGVPGNNTDAFSNISSWFDSLHLNVNGFFYVEDIEETITVQATLGNGMPTDINFTFYGHVSNGLNSYSKPLGNYQRHGLGLYYFDGFSIEDFPILEGGSENASEYIPNIYYQAGGMFTYGSELTNRIQDVSQIIKPTIHTHYSNDYWQTHPDGLYNVALCGLYKNLKDAINAYTSTSGVKCEWTDGVGADQLAGLEIWADDVGTAFNNDNIEFTLNSTSMEGTVTQVTQTRGTTNLDLLSTEDRVDTYITDDGVVPTDVDKGNGVVLAGQTYMSGGVAATADVYTLTFGGGANNGDDIFINITPTGANVSETNLQLKNTYTSVNNLATAAASLINSIGTITANAVGSVVTITGTAATANGFNVNVLTAPDSMYNGTLEPPFYTQTEEDNQYILINKTNELHVDEEFNYKSNLKLYSTNNGSWLDIFSYENSNDNNYPTTSFFDWYYTADNDNKPIMVFNGDRVYLADSNLNLDNNNKYLSFIDNSHFFQNPAIDDTNNDGFTFSGRTFGWFLEDSIKKWIFTAGTTANSNWNFPDNMGVRIDANSSVTTEYSAIEAKMNFKIYAGTTDGVDWSGNIKVFLAAVYDDRSESLPGHQFTFSGGAETLDLSAEGAFLKIECSIRPQNDSEEYLFNDRRITGIRLYYSSDEDDYEIFWNLGLLDFNKGFIRATEIQTLDDVTGNASRYVWSNNGMTGANAVRLWDINAGSNNEIISYLTQPRVDDYSSINELEITGSSPPTTLDVRYKAICIAGRRAFIGNLKVVDNNGTRYYNDRMMFSPQNTFDIFPNSDSNILELETFDGDEIIALASYGNKVLQFKKNVLYILDISGEASSWFVEKRELYKGIANNHSFCETNEGIFWFNEFGAYLYDGEEIKNLFSTNEEESVNRINLENWNTFISSESICGFNPKSREVFVVKKTTHSSEADGDCYVYNLMTKSWVKGANKFFTGGKITNLINAGDLRKIGFFTSTDPGTSGVPKGETDNPGVPF